MADDKPTPPGGHKPPHGWRLDQLEHAVSCDHDRLRRLELVQTIAVGEDGKGGRMDGLSRAVDSATARITEVERGLNTMERNAAVERVKLGLVMVAASAVGAASASVILKLLLG